MILAYIALAAVILASAIAAVLSENLLRAAVALGVGSAALATLFFLLDAPYAGGFELSVGASVALGIWEAIMEIGRPLGIVPTGIGARNTLRLEAGMPLYGHELSEQVNPFQAGLAYTCYLVGYDFPGRDALKVLQAKPLDKTRVGLQLAGQRVGRQGGNILAEGRIIGRITSGSHSPTLKKPIAMGYVPPEFARPGTQLQIDVRGRIEPARIVKLPFYRRSKKGSHP